MKENNGNKISISVKEFFIALLNERDKRINLHFELIDKAVNKSETAALNKYAELNEFRGQQKDIVNTMMPRSEQDTINCGLRKDISDLKTDTYKRIEDLKSYVDISKGEKTGKRDFTATIISIISLFGVIIAIVINLTKCVGG